MWLANTMVSKINHDDFMEFEEFINKVNNTNIDENISNKSPEDITNEFLPIVEIDRKKGDLNG